MRRRTAVLLFVLGAMLCAGGAAIALLLSSSSSATHPLRVIAAPTPRFIRGYDTIGRYPNVSGAPNLGETNAALRQAILDDQDQYAKYARPAVKSSRDGGNPYNGIYETWVKRSLTSASTSVVSTLIPALELYPGGNDGQMWISATVDVETGQRVALRAVLAHPSRALPAIARAWDTAFIRQLRHCGGQCRQWWATMKPGSPATFANFRDFALLPSGLAIGLPQYPAGSRMVEIVPYRVIRAYLTPLGQTLVAGVMRPAPAS
jgi:hypothetical protein